MQNAVHDYPDKILVTENKDEGIIGTSATEKALSRALSEVEIR